jgi:hypothetical protein
MTWRDLVFAATTNRRSGSSPAASGRTRRQRGDDVDAIEKGKRLVEANDIELWCGERLVMDLTSTSPDPME